MVVVCTSPLLRSAGGVLQCAEDVAADLELAEGWEEVFGSLLMLRRLLLHRHAALRHRLCLCARALSVGVRGCAEEAANYVCFSARVPTLVHTTCGVYGKKWARVRMVTMKQI